jgi:putative transposase
VTAARRYATSTMEGSGRKLDPDATLYNWKAKYGGMDVSDAKRLRSLEEENRKLKKLLAESMLDQAALKELLTKKW